MKVSRNEKCWCGSGLKYKKHETGVLNNLHPIHCCIYNDN